MRKTLGVCLLALLLTAPAAAGEIPNGSPAPPSQPATAVQESSDGATLEGEIPNGVADSLTQTALELLAVLPAIL